MSLTLKQVPYFPEIVQIHRMFEAEIQYSVAFSFEEKYIII